MFGSQTDVSTPSITGIVFGEDGSTLNLRTYAVVAVGFEKVVWQEVPPPTKALTHLAIKTKE